MARQPPEEPWMTMKADQYTHDLRGNEVDGWYWQLTEERPQEHSAHGALHRVDPEQV